MSSIFDSSVSGQTTTVQQTQALINKTIEESGNAFREGMIAIKANKRDDAGEKFDKAVEFFLTSSLSVQSDQRLQSCYVQLLETVYRIEFPSDQQVPQLRNLSSTCGWRWNNVDMKLADDVVAIVNLTATMKTGDPVVESNSAQGDRVTATTYSRPASANVTPAASNVKIVKAQSGDTVAKLAARHNANATEVAKFNGLLPNSVLGAGREIKLATSEAPIYGRTHKSDQYTTTHIFTKKIEDLNKICSGTYDSPRIQGLKLGVTSSTVGNLLSRKLSLKKTYLFGMTQANVTNLAGVTSLNLNFYKDQLSSIIVLYDNSIKWKDLKEFRDVVSKSISLPNNAWEETSDTHIFVCPNRKFDLTLSRSIYGIYSLVITDKILRDKRWQDQLAEVEAERKRIEAAARRKELEQEQKKKAFKP